MVTVRVRPMGERALLLETDSIDDVLALHGRLAASRPEGVVELVPAARTVLVVVDPARLTPAAARAWALGADAGAAGPPRGEGSAVDLEVVYDGADLSETAELLGMTADELVRRHASAEWSVAFTGFAPGFGYLVSDAWPFDVPRRATPRTRVPAGAVGLAARFTGAYPRESPGGWQLIGTTSALLWRTAAEGAASPALLAPGTRVRFRPVTAAPVAAAAVSVPAPAPASTTSTVPAPVPVPASTARLQTQVETAGEPHGLGAPLQSRGHGQRGVRVEATGMLATVQDLGRAGNAALGVARSGAADRGALRTANRLVGNDEGAAAIEITMGGFRAVAEVDAWIAVAGAWGSLTLDGRPIDPYTAQAWSAGSELQVDVFAHGTRAYLAVRGGCEPAAVLGSRSTDIRAGLGPRRLAAGDVIPIGPAPARPIPIADIAPWGAPQDDELEIDLAPGPRADWFAASALDVLFAAVWTVSPAADRVGIRLEGPELVRARRDELPSEGMVPGALQVPPDGRPVVLGVDGPVTGGYPVIAVATDAALDLLAQARPGTRLRFRHARTPIG
ncbi:5-oxoprolinase/urea amidolyase family protein [Microbacterium sp. NPDC055910]|uniref:5-oxoprolinase subunit B/C family protein n=1 Tax=Microbacterium sp. NPDC055910 TaxID=3345659 RepID=UPI0035DBD21C